MKTNFSEVVHIAILNIRNNLTRTVGLTFLVAILSFVLFGGAVLSLSMQNGLQNMKDRLGADIMVVPLENDADMEAILLKGEPSCFYLSKSVENKIAELEGVSLCTSQFFLSSLEAACCDTQVQLIGFDPDTDFSVQPWIERVYAGELEEGAVIIGSDISTDLNEKIKLFNTEYEVSARLDKTGTGLDQAVFATMDTIKLMYADAYEGGQRFLEEADPQQSVSSVLIRVADGYDTKTLVRNIRKELGGVQVVESRNMITGTAENLKNFDLFLYIVIGLIFTVAVLTLLLVFSVTANERKKEFAILRTIGATGKTLSAIVRIEAFLISTAGGVIGAIVAALFVFPFHVYIGDRLGMPYILPSIHKILLVLLVDLVVALLIGPLSASLAATKISKAETYITMREGD